MDFPPTNQYQSRLFNFLNRQSIRFKEQLGQTGRNLKIAVELGVQIILYPLYLLVQTGRTAQRQLRQKTQARQVLPPESEPITVNQAIAHILTTVDPWLSEGELTNKRNLSRDKSSNISLNKIIIQGVASVIETRQLVLVTADNNLIDNLSPQQNTYLKQRIFWEVANYQYQRRLELSAVRKFPGLVPNFQIHSQTVVPPVRWFWTVIRWVQTGSVALAINLFEESTLISISPETSVKTDNNLSRENQMLEPDPFQIQVLIQAAIDYFFGQNQQQIALNNNPNISPTPNVSGQSYQSLPHGAEPDPWLSWDDLYSQSPETEAPAKFTVTYPTQLPAVHPTPVKPSNTPYIQVKSHLNQQNQPKSIITQPVQPKELAKQQQQTKTVVTTEQKSSVIVESQTKVNPLEVASQWIETEATPAGYVKHPLVRILEWLDQLILWGEEFLLKLWNWLKDHVIELLLRIK